MSGRITGGVIKTQKQNTKKNVSLARFGLNGNSFLGNVSLICNIHLKQHIDIFYVDIYVDINELNCQSILVKTALLNWGTIQCS